MVAGPEGQPRSAGLAGSVRPKRRLPVTPLDLRGRLRTTQRRPSRSPAPTWPGRVPRPPVKKTLGIDYDTEWARRHPARLARVVVQEFVSEPLLRALASPQCRRPGPHRPPRRAGDIRRQPRQPPRRPPHPVSDPGPMAAPDVRRRRGRLLLRHPPQGDHVRLPSQRRPDRAPAGQPRDSANRAWSDFSARAGACSSSPKGGAAPTDGASRTGPARPGRRPAPAARSSRCIWREPARSCRQGSGPAAAGTRPT